MKYLGIFSLLGTVMLFDLSPCLAQDCDCQWEMAETCMKQCNCPPDKVTPECDSCYSDCLYTECKGQPGCSVNKNDYSTQKNKNLTSPKK